MSIRRLLGLAIFIVGIILLIVGLQSTGAISEKVAKQVQGRYTDTTMWYIIGGSVMIVIGAVIAFARSLRK
jgi:uncharacterized membrane protein YidH (DUF202 family)